VLCFTLIPLWGITGAALATISTLVINSLFQVFLQRVAFGIYGVNRKLLIIMAIGALSFLAGWLIPETSLIPDILMRSITVTLVFTGLVYLLKISSDMNVQINGFLKHFFKR
jgi:O-antigen/teichoic acid export membrane protein